MYLTKEEKEQIICCLLHYSSSLKSRKFYNSEKIIKKIVLKIKEELEKEAKQKAESNNNIHGTCPKCKSENITYCDGYVKDEQYIYECVCDDCEAEFKEINTIDFLRNEV